ncbi:peroxidase 5 [Brachypodium distachyon]|uniref:Peroxidase n=1 Tax=Brachypodium distachyon TaxID=15368 RepID=I1GYJ3_BRADI|nr:peroxidase 5 [Brachypodium distachyon]KQK18352.1 hypothetical protein BRADI_1g41900v3 [Brachypodium distachyon]|eukprot:XP_003563857.1 peroxidase 5 [Brachypodium distachyon]
MARLTVAMLFFVLALALAPRNMDAVVVESLQPGFYNQSCPEVEQVVRDVVDSEVGMDHTLAPGLIRIFFHDCFITGCDASILLDESPAGDVPEKQSSANGFTLHGLRTIDIAKSTLEAMCPRTVSCSDIVAFAARDAAVAAGLPTYEVAAGRRDGEHSRMDDLPGNFPVPGHTVPRLTELFQKRGLSQEDLVVLSGAHSIGGAHCFMFSNRIYGFSKTADIDPSLDPAFAKLLREMCPRPKPDDNPEEAPKIDFDQRTAQKLDNSYYNELLARRSLLTSDSALVQDPATRPIVESFAKDDALWQKKFGEAMQKVGKLDVLTRPEEGQIRRNCRMVNRPKSEMRTHMGRISWPKPRHPMLQMMNWFIRGFQQPA